MEEQLDALIIQNKQNADETNGLLETMISQNEKNNLQPEMEAIISQNEQLKEVVSQSASKIEQAIIKDKEKPVDSEKLISFVDNFLSTIKGEKGDTPDDDKLKELIKPLIPEPIKGDKGDKPSKEELLEIIEPLIPEPIKGEDGYTPVKGKDYFTDEDIKKIIDSVIDVIPEPEVVNYDKVVKDVIKQLPKIEKPKEINIDDLVSKLKDKISYSDLKDLPQALRVSARDYDFIELKDVPNSYKGQAGKVVSVKSDETGLEFTTSTSSDEKVKYDANDPNAGYLSEKIIAGTDISISEGTGANENKLVVSYTGGSGGDMLASVYDPTNVANDAFNMDNMVQGTNNLFISQSDYNILSQTSGINTGDQDLSGLVPYNGATGDIDIAENLLSLSSIRATTNSGGVNILNHNSGTVASFGIGSADSLNSSLAGNLTVADRIFVNGVGASSIGTSIVEKKLNLGGNLLFQQVANVTTSDLNAITLTETTGGTLGAGEYYYNVAYVTAEGDSSCPPVSPKNITVSANGAVVLSNLPVSADARVTHKKIYRSTLGDSGRQYFQYLVTTIPNSQTSYTDSGSATGTEYSYWKSNTTAGLGYVKIGSATTVKLWQSDEYNSSFGVGSLNALTRGNGNAGFGSFALGSTTTGSSCTAVGYYAGYYNTTGTGNNSFGYATQQGNQVGSHNNSFGYNSLRNETLASYTGNNAMGTFSLGALGSGDDYNNAMGHYAGYGARADYGVYIGAYAGYQSTPKTVGIGQIVIGSNSGQTLGTGNYNVLIGYSVELATPNTSNQLNIGNVIYATGLGTGSSPSATGKVGIGTATPTANLEVYGVNSALQYIRVVNSGTYAVQMGVNSTQAYIGSSNATTVNFIVDNANRMTILPTSGNVGIANTSPAEKLDVTGNIKLSGNIELGHASDTTLSRSSAGVLAVEGVVVPTISSTNTLTNKRITPRITTITSHATPTINTDNCDAVTITAQAEAITSMTTNLSGTPTNFQRLLIRIKDNGTARAITWGTSFQSGSATLPTTTVAGKTLMVGLIYDSVDSKWTCEATGSRA